MYHPPVGKVRLKSSQRKQRSDVAQQPQRAPTQRRSRKKYEDILKAAERLLQHSRIEDIALSDIGDVIAVPMRSVHYYFPTVAKIQLELYRRYDHELHHIIARHGDLVEKSNFVNWQDYVRSSFQVARNYFNLRRAACEVVLGPMLGRENRLASIEANSQAGAAMILVLQRMFGLVYRPEIEAVFTASCDILYLFWSASYLRSGRIDDEALASSLRASLGYLESFVPDLIRFDPS